MDLDPYRIETLQSHGIQTLAYRTPSLSPTSSPNAG